MKHEQRKHYLKTLRKMWEWYEMKDVEKYGEPERLAKAMEIRENVTYIWSGGPCNENATFDVSIEVPSESNFKTTSYELHFKIFPGKSGFLQIKQVSPCYCYDKRYTNSISRFVLPCKHEIAGRMALERDLKKLLEKSVKEEKTDKKVLEMWYERRYVEQEDSTLWYVRWLYPKEILEFRKILEEKFKKLKRDRFFTALLRKSIFYYNLAKTLGKEDVEFFSGEELFYPR